jgi:hypothetical protein
MSLQKVAISINEQLARRSKMKIGAIIQHPDGRNVKIKSGAFLRNGRVSNFWYWNEVKEDGSLGEDECGYGW